MSRRRSRSSWSRTRARSPRARPSSPRRWPRACCSSPAGGMDGRRARHQLRHGRGGAGRRRPRTAGRRSCSTDLGSAVLTDGVGARAARRGRRRAGAAARTRRSSRVRSRRPSRRTGERTSARVLASAEHAGATFGGPPARAEPRRRAGGRRAGAGRRRCCGATRGAAQPARSARPARGRRSPGMLAGYDAQGARSTASTPRACSS